ncbi:MAG TPA: hypothetical protein VG324_21410, partial [Blastocatellia bacterium]|nr:hypothetical protein [Blastocatellia bacterium]
SPWLNQCANVVWSDAVYGTFIFASPSQAFSAFWPQPVNATTDTSSGNNFRECGAGLILK